MVSTRPYDDDDYDDYDSRGDDDDYDDYDSRGDDYNYKGYDYNSKGYDYNSKGYDYDYNIYDDAGFHDFAFILQKGKSGHIRKKKWVLPYWIFAASKSNGDY